MWSRSVPSLALDLVTPGDEGWRDRLADHLLALTPVSRQNRFLASTAESMLRRHAETTAPACLVEARIEGETCGFAELHLAGGEAEIALSVVDRWQGRGIGRLLFTRAAREGWRRGATEEAVYYLRSNQAMRRIAEGAGFVRVPDDDPAVAHARALVPVSRLTRLWRTGTRAFARA
ncbi:MAG: GNAT family N-acetyltransferase [Rhodobacteraceae bacterium]|nr:GNAT family N-acetyltransferase [Paracoccaceae bacterium]